MKRIFALFLAAVFLDGCAAIKKQGAWDIKPAAIHEVEQPYEALAVKFPEHLESLWAVVLPINSEWIGDGIGYFLIKEKENQRIFLRREVWRSVLVEDNQEMEVFACLISQYGTHLFCLFPNKQKQDVKPSLQFFILSGSSRYVMTTKGEIAQVDMHKFQEDTAYRQEFIAKHSSPLLEARVINLSPETTAGKAFIADFTARYPGISNLGYRISSDTLTASEVTNHSSVLDKIISQSSAVISPLLFASWPSAALGIGRILWSVTQAANDSTLRGSFFEGSFSGEEIGKTLGYYLKNNARRIAILQQEVGNAREIAGNP